MIKDYGLEKELTLPYNLSLLDVVAETTEDIAIRGAVYLETAVSGKDAAYDLFIEDNPFGVGFTRCQFPGGMFYLNEDVMALIWITPDEQLTSNPQLETVRDYFLYLGLPADKINIKEGKNDVFFGDKKLAGSSTRVTGGSSVHGFGFSLDMDADRINQIIKVKKHADKIEDRSTTMLAATGKKYTPEELYSSFKTFIEEKYAMASEAVSLTPEQQNRATEIQNEVYLDTNFNQYGQSRQEEG